MQTKIKAFFRKENVLVLLVLVFAASSLLNREFLTKENLLTILKQNSVVCILALGETLLIIGGMIDLASGAVLAVAGVISIIVYKETGSLPLAFVTGIGMGMFFNAISGAIIAAFRTPPFIAALAVKMVARGAILLITNGRDEKGIGDFIMLGRGSLAFLPIPVIFTVLMVIFTWYMLHRTRFGKNLYALGTDRKAAQTAGVNVPKTQLICYLLNGVLVGLAGMIFMSLEDAGIPSAGSGYEFDALTASVIGGASFSGGTGTAIGTLFGALIICVLNDTMRLLAVNAYLQEVIKGSIIAIAVIVSIQAKIKQAPR